MSKFATLQIIGYGAITNHLKIYAPIGKRRSRFSFDFHLDSIRELCRIAREVRVFPLLTLVQVRSPYINEICNTLAKEGISSEIIQVPYELQKGGNQAIVFRQ